MTMTKQEIIGMAIEAELAACPCGGVPKELYLVDGSQGGKWAWVYGSCCGEWHIEFRTDYNDLESEKCKELAREAWNRAPRAANERSSPTAQRSGAA